MDDSSSEEEDLPIRFTKQKAVKKKFPEKKQPPLISFNDQVITLTFVLSLYLIAKRVIIMLITFSTLNEELCNGFTALCSLLFAISAIVYVRDKSNIINRSNDNDNEDWPPEELVFEYTLEHAKGEEYVPEDVMYARFHSDIIETVWMDDSTFKDNEKLEMVILNEGLRNIGDGMFEGCESLQKIKFPSTLVEVCEDAFRDCGLKKVELNDGLEVIGSDAFVNCKSLKSIEFPSTVRRIGESAFYDCSSLKKIVLNEGLRKVEDGVFRGCISLESIKFPSTIRYIGAHAFDHLSPVRRSDLKEVVFNDGLLRIEERAFNECRSLLQVEVPSSVKYLGERAFYGCKKLRKVVLNEVNTIDNEAFSDCRDLKEVLFKEGLQGVGKASFSWCTSLERISFPSSLEKVGEKVFKDCKNLKEVTFSNGCNLKRVGKNAFRNCESLERISITFPRLQYLIQVGHANINHEIITFLICNVLQNNNIGLTTYLAERIPQRY